MPLIKVSPIGETFEYEAGKTLLEILLERNCFVENPCNGKGSCGKCRVRIVSGNTEAKGATELEILSDKELKADIRLSCFVKPVEDLEVEILEKERKHEVLTSGYVPEFEFDTSNNLYGVAMDIGTTTVVCTLIDMSNGKEIAKASSLNAQKRFGVDILTRITYEMEHKETGVKELQKAIVDSVNVLISECCKKAGIEKEYIHEVSVAANCTMMHTLLGVDATSIGKAPYEPVFTEAKEMKASGIGIKVAEDARLYCLPAVSSYIGADIVAGAYVCELQKQKGNVLFIDIGTNGEIILSKEGELLCCSCAAGPAFEGMNISAGMRAAEGAIENVEISEKGIYLQVIGNCEPVGICGSGILAAVKELLRVGLIGKEGAFMKKDALMGTDYRYPMLQVNGSKREFILVDDEEPILITQEDIYQVQLAKAAIQSGVIALLDKAGIVAEELDKVIIAGQFGIYLPENLLTGTGILPEEVKNKIVYVGNTSRAGAYMALMSEKVKLEMEELAEEMDYMELGATENYEKVFMNCLYFPDCN